MFYELSFLFAFLPGVLLAATLARLIHPRGAALVLLCASAVFCFRLDPYTLHFCLAYAGLNLAAAIMLARRPTNLACALIVSANVLVLGFYKYTAFALASLGLAQAAQGFTPLAPLGLSFLFFRAVSAALEIRRGQVAQVAPLDYLLYLAYFPTFLAGPVATLAELQGQTRAPRAPDLQDALAGLCLVGVGLFKKVMLADNLTPFARGAFAAAASGGELHFIEAWGAALAYAFELYFDFSGYSDMAIGISRLCGIRLPANFDSPYKALSIKEFWRRWHITLSRFLRDNLYIPLGGNRKGKVRALGNAMLVMGLCGLWHGAGWTFVLWGLLHGAYLCANTLWQGLASRLAPRPGLSRAMAPLCWCITFTAVVLAWVPFRAASLDAALAMWQAMFSPTSNLFVPLGASGTQAVPFEYFPGRRLFILPEGVLPHFAGWLQVAWLAAGLAIATLGPSSQRFLAALEPVTGKAAPQPAAPFAPAASLGWRSLACGALFCVAVISLWFQTTPSAFLYARF